MHFYNWWSQKLQMWCTG